MDQVESDLQATIRVNQFFLLDLSAVLLFDGERLFNGTHKAPTDIEDGLDSPDAVKRNKQDGMQGVLRGPFYNLVSKVSG